jgi:hypothetical protein
MATTVACRSVDEDHRSGGSDTDGHSSYSDISLSDE